MDVACDAGSGSASDVHADVDAVGGVELAQNAFHFLCERDHFMRGGVGEFLQLVEMRVGDDHHVAGGVWIRIKDDEAILATMHDANFSVVPFFGKIAEDASGDFSRGGDVCVAPRGPQIVHGVGE